MLTITVGFFHSGHKLIVDVVIFATDENNFIAACRPVYTMARPQKLSFV